MFVSHSLYYFIISFLFYCLSAVLIYTGQLVTQSASTISATTRLALVSTRRMLEGIVWRMDYTVLSLTGHMTSDLQSTTSGDVQRKQCPLLSWRLVSKCIVITLSFLAFALRFYGWIKSPLHMWLHLQITSVTSGLKMPLLSVFVITICHYLNCK